MKRVFALVLVVVFCLSQISFAMDRKKDFGNLLLKDGQGAFQGQKMLSLPKINDDVSLTENIRNLFYPSGTTDQHSNTLWKLIRTIMVGVLIGFIIWAGFRFILDADDETAVKKNQMNLLFIIVGGGIIFIVTRLLGDALSLGSVQGVVNQNDGITPGVSLLDRAEKNIFVVVLGFLKGFIFFLAVIMLMYYGYQMIIAFDKEDKIKNARTGILNVILALIFIKIIDFLYFIAQQPNFTTQANDLILVIVKFLGYIFGILIVLVIIYIAFQFITAGEEGFKKGLKFLKNLVIIALVVFLFLLVLYQALHDIV